jgi:hypothetical protein
MRFTMTLAAMLLVGGHAFAATPNDMAPMLENLQRMLTKQGSMTPEKMEQQRRQLQMGVVALKMHQCAEASVGKPRLDAFMDDMNVVGKTIENYCKNNMPDQALGLALGTLKSKYNDPVAIAGRNCYYEHKAELEPLLPTDIAADTANYERWAEDPTLAASEAKPTDICK